MFNNHQDSSGAMHTFLNPMLLDTLSKPPSVNVFQNITAGEDLFQLSALPTTSAKLISAKAQTTQCFGDFSDSTFQQILKNRYASTNNGGQPGLHTDARLDGPFQRRHLAVIGHVFLSIRWQYSLPGRTATYHLDLQQDRAQGLVDLQFILDHPRRCYTLLFPSQLTWILFDIIFLLKFVDVLLVILLDLHNPAVNSLSLGPRILAAIFQAASARNTGTSSFNLANVNPAVQFSLVIMMYIAILPIAISIRSSNTYEERALGVYSHEEGLGESNGSS
ncbi:Cation transporter [Penicillium occitanis (nom. inval.)]|nr:Cation transporter [Penicillium occitanis (nom. inval.)]PCG96846.1 hypothetical protein PENOC_070960 [Penicillium occitanis (nom. inval.)]